MTLPEIANKHLDLWFADGPPQHVPSRPSLLDRVVDALTEAQDLRDKLWQDGNATYKHERDAALAKLAGINAALNMDLYPDQDAETVARRLYHEFPAMERSLDEQARIISGLRRDLAAATRDAALNDERLFLPVDFVLKQNAEYERKLAEMAKCRDDAVEACRIAVGEKRP